MTKMREIEGDMWPVVGDRSGEWKCDHPLKRGLKLNQNATWIGIWEEELFQNFWQTLRLQSSSRQPIHIITNQEERGRKNHNGLSTNITRSSFCGGGVEAERGRGGGRGDGSLSLELPDENARSDDGVHVKSESIG